MTLKTTLPTVASPPRQPCVVASSGRTRTNNNNLKGALCCTALSTKAAPPISAALEIRHATISDYWPVSDMHCSAFYPRASSFWQGLLRLDRVLSLHVGNERQGPEIGQFACLIAADEESKASISSPCSSSVVIKEQESSLGPIIDLAVKTLFPPSFRENYCASHIAEGIQGAIVLDTLAEHLPPRRVTYNGVIRDIRRHGIAYVSNLAVSPSARRRGIGLHLLTQAEALAQQWGCRSVALHVDPTNIPAVALYKAAGYKIVMQQPQWQQWLEGRQHALVLMLRVLPRKNKGEE